jgi:hypothetical protein
MEKNAVDGILRSIDGNPPSPGFHSESFMRCIATSAGALP